MAYNNKKIVFLLLIIYLLNSKCFGDKKYFININQDNDYLSSGNKDRDYTFGSSVTFSIKSKSNVLSFSSGLFGFTPRKKQQPSPVTSDRPYASLAYFNLNLLKIKTTSAAIKHTFSFGMLGTNLMKNIQNNVHTEIGYSSVKGWKNQISHGGEPTLRYQFSIQKDLTLTKNHSNLIGNLSMSAGYLTQLKGSLYARIGRITSPWWHFQPIETTYGEKTINLLADHSEYFLDFGIELTHRQYNSMLQGQFKKSVLTLSSDEIHPVLFSAWIGLTFQYKKYVKLSYKNFFQTPEVKLKDSGRKMSWGNIELTMRF